MIFQCQDLDRALRSPELMPDARAHAAECADCREQLYLWSEISRLAPSLHEEWDSPSLWPRISADLAAVATPRKSIPIYRWALAAAAVVTLALALSQPWQSKKQERDFLTEDALSEVQRAESVYARSIEKLSVVAGDSLQQSTAPLAGAYREKLALLDSAIADLKANVDNNRYNVYLQTQLASLYREKQKTLQEWLENAKRN
ncbi:MAG TPA: hypothetical protein VGH38_22965 [Bryobacteraceae bacterium]|jgi:hypothetical protein